jgi:Holliday junction DNA helicase RuvA
MIATLSGIINEKLDELVVVEAGGVGYGVLVPAEDFAQLVIGGQAKLYVYEHIREQSHDLFGFLRRDTQLLFEQLLDVNGVGPKMALNMLSIGSLTEVRNAIAAGDIKFIQQAAGVGKKVAERVVVELKDKVGLIGVDLGTAGLLQGEQAARADEAVEALMALGFSVADASKALAGIDPQLATKERVKLALKESAR